MYTWNIFHSGNVYRKPERQYLTTYTANIGSIEGTRACGARQPIKYTFISVKYILCIGLLNFANVIVVSCQNIVSESLW